MTTLGTPAAVVTVLDGYPMAQKGLAGEALGLATIGSGIGGGFFGVGGGMLPMFFGGSILDMPSPIGFD